LGISDEMTIGFWLYPSNLGMVKNLSTDLIESAILPVINLMIPGNISDAVVTVYEYTLAESKNKLQVTLDNESYGLFSESYDAYIWHYFWIKYDGFTLSIYIDGKLSSTLVIENPSIINDGAVVDLYINKHKWGNNNYQYGRNFGIIDEICIFNEVFPEVDMQTTVNYGISYFIDTDYNTIKFKDYGINFNDPDIITVNSVVNDISYIYLGRNDGKILRGSPLFWESRRTFSDPREQYTYEEEIVGEELPNIDKEASKATIQNGLLRITNSIVRL
jgi:hypothetical protein